MAIFGFGAFFNHKEDVSEQFIDGNCACVGWSEEEAPPAHNILRLVRTGDIVFIKAFIPRGGSIMIKAVGIVTEGKVRNYSLGDGVPVKWVWTGKECIGKLDDKWPVRGVTIYEEHHPVVQEKIIELLLSNRNFDK